jgi:hypothetical protein
MADRCVSQIRRAVVNAGFILLMLVSGVVIPSRSCLALSAR